MTCVKSILLGAAATLMTALTGQAADLPSRKSAPVEYVRICDAYGAGFYWVPGTDTCLKVGGRVRIDAWMTPAKNAVTHRTILSANPPNTFVSANAVDSTGWYARGYIAMDARTQSAWGTVQTYISMYLSSQSGLANTPPGYVFGGFAAGNASAPTIESAYIRFAGFTVGQYWSNFGFVIAPQLHTMFNGGFPNGIRQLAYTATFGNGFSTTLALENSGELYNSLAWNTLGANPFSPTAASAGSAGLRLPAVVANVRVDQSWGSAKLAGLVLQNRATFGNAPLAVVGNNGPAITRTGWAVLGGLGLNLPMLAAGDRFDIEASYTVGALDYVMSYLNSGIGTSGNNLGGFLRADRNMTIYCLDVGCTAGGAEQTRAFSVAGYFTHYWTPTLRSNVLWSLAHVTPGRVTQATPWANGGLGRGTTWSIQNSLIWSPVQNFNIGVEASYTRLNQSLPFYVPTPLTALAKVNPNNFTVRTSVQRAF